MRYPLSVNLSACLFPSCLWARYLTIINDGFDKRLYTATHRTKQSSKISNKSARFPPFRCRSSVAVSPFPLAVAVSVYTVAAAVAYPFAVYGCNGAEEEEFIFHIITNNMQCNYYKLI